MKKTTFLLTIGILYSLTIKAQIIMTASSSDSSVDTQSFTWDDGVVLTAEKITGEAANVIYDNEFADKGFGIKGARWKQIDYYQDYQGNEVNASEKLIIDFNGLVNNLEITLGMMGLNEGIGSDDETGKWTAYDTNDNIIGTGEVGPAESELGVDVKISGSYGKYPFSINVGQSIAKIILEATGFGYNSTNGPKYVNSYNNDSGNTENNSDFNLFRISYNRDVLSTVDVEQEKFILHPNPMSSEFSIVSKINHKISKIEIYDVTGKKVIKMNGSKTMVDVSSLHSGVYLLRIGLENGNTVSKKIIKQ